MTRHTEEDFARAVREITSQPGHSGEVTNYQIAMHLERSPGGGLYKQMNEWRSGSLGPGTAKISRGVPTTAALKGKVNDHILSIDNATASDIAAREIDTLRALYLQTVTERDRAYREIAHLTQRLANARIYEHALLQELSAFHFSEAYRKAQIQLAAAELSASLRPPRLRKFVNHSSA